MGMELVTKEVIEKGIEVVGEVGKETLKKANKEFGESIKSKAVDGVYKKASLDSNSIRGSEFYKNIQDIQFENNSIKCIEGRKCYSDDNGKLYRIDNRVVESTEFCVEGNNYKTDKIGRLLSNETGLPINEAADNSIEELSTIRKDLEGQFYPETNVKYERKIISVEGKLKEGVFPQFSSVFETRLPNDMLKRSDNEQFRYCTGMLVKEIKRNPELAKQFSEKQIEQISTYSPNIAKLTWHHNEETGVMQLVDYSIHDKCKHTGGRSIWGGGTLAR